MGKINAKIGKIKPQREDISAISGRGENMIIQGGLDRYIDPC
jgi:hypothetical protein